MFKESCYLFFFHYADDITYLFHQVARDAKEAIHIRINNAALNHNTGNVYSRNL